MHRDRRNNPHYFYLSSNALLESCPIPKSYIRSTNSGNNVLIVAADASMKLSEYLKKSKNHMEYHHVEIMIDCIGKQLQILENNDMGIPIFHLDDITVFFMKKQKDTSQRDGRHSHPHRNETDDDDDDDDDDSSSDDDDDTKNKNILYDNKYNIYFAITNDDKICTFTTIDDHDHDHDHAHQQVVINTPLKTEFPAYQKNKSFISPELKEFKEQKKIPYNIHFKSGYYSFGLLCIYCMLTKHTVSFDEVDNTTTLLMKSENEIKECLLSRDVSPAKEISGGGGGGGGGGGSHKTSDTLSNTSIIKNLRSIINTKIYWFLLRVLKRNPSERRYICV